VVVPFAAPNVFDNLRYVGVGALLGRRHRTVLTKHAAELIEPAREPLEIELRDHHKRRKGIGHAGRTVAIAAGGARRPVEEEDEPFSCIVGRLVVVQIQRDAVEIDLDHSLADRK